MAEKKLSPRQKMINLMYLVLTAMLALNVSAEILKAFELIEASIRKSTSRIQNKIDEEYSTFSEKLMTEGEKKVKVWYDKAMSVKQQTQHLYTYIDTLKFQVMDLAGGDKGKTYDEKFKLFRKDDREAGEHILFNLGKVYNLKKTLIQYRSFLVKLIEQDTSKNAQILKKNILKSLSTDSLYNENEKTWVAWEKANFSEMPAVAVVAMLTKLQNDIKNVEADVLAYLLGKIGEGEFHFNKIYAVVNSKKSFVLVNEPYQAEVFLAAADTTQQLVIKLKEGNPDYLKIEGGMGIYKPPTGSVGTFKWGGVIKVKNPAGTDTLEFPFESEYQVVQPAVSISPTKMNVFYIGVDNPVAITASGVPDNALRVVMTNGTIRKVGTGKYIVRPRSVDKNATKTRISVSAQVQGAARSLGSMKFRVLRIPDPYPVVGGKKGGVVAKSWLIAQTFVKAQLDNFVFDLKFPVVEFTVSATIKGFTEEIKSKGATITPQQKSLIRQLKHGQKVYFENVKAKAPDGSIRQIGSISFKLR